jgi:hypothetical protein
VGSLRPRGLKPRRFWTLYAALKRRSFTVVPGGTGEIKVKSNVKGGGQECPLHTSLCESFSCVPSGACSCLPRSRACAPGLHSYAASRLRRKVCDSGSYLHSTRLSWDAMICHVPPRFSQVSVQTWHTFALGWDLSLPTAYSRP